MHHGTPSGRVWVSLGVRCDDVRRFSQSLCAIVGIATISFYTISYIGGRQGMPLSVAGLPAQIIPALLGLICLGCLLVTLIVALIRRRERPVALATAGLALLFFMLVFAVAPATVFQIGFRSRITSTVTPDELREIALVAHETLPEGGRLPGPEKWSLWNEDEHQTQWDSLVKRTAIAKLDPWMLILKHPDSVELSWGGAVVGHWGVIIDTGTEQRDGDIATGIRSYISSH